MVVFEERGNRSTRRKPLGAEKRTTKLNPHMTPDLGIEPGPHWWEASALTTVPSLHPKALFLFSLGTIVSLKRNWKQCSYQIWGDKQRVLWHFPKWPIIEKNNSLNYLDFCQNIDFNHVSFSFVLFFFGKIPYLYVTRWASLNRSLIGALSIARIRGLHRWSLFIYEKNHINMRKILNQGIYIYIFLNVTNRSAKVEVRTIISKIFSSR